MSNEDLVLNIAVNMGRLSRWAMEGKENRIKQFINDTDYYMRQLGKSPRQPYFEATYKAFNHTFKRLKSDIRLDRDWAEDALTWANILTHRAKLA